MPQRWLQCPFRLTGQGRLQYSVGADHRTQYRAAARRGRQSSRSRRLVLVGVSHHHCLSLDLGVEPNELAHMAFNGARMGRYLGCVLVVDDTQLERVSVVRGNVFVGVVCASIGWLCVVCEVKWFLDGCGKWNLFS